MGLKSATVVRIAILVVHHRNRRLYFDIFLLHLQALVALENELVSINTQRSRAENVAMKYSDMCASLRGEAASCATNIVQLTEELNYHKGVVKELKVIRKRLHGSGKTRKFLHPCTLWDAERKILCLRFSNRKGKEALALVE